jgi:hypothetical protein
MSIFQASIDHTRAFLEKNFKIYENFQNHVQSPILIVFCNNFNS